MSNFLRIESMFLRIKHSPFRSLHRILHRCKVSAPTLAQLKELLVINPSVPLAIDLEGLLGDQHAARVLVLAGNFVPREQITQSLTELDDLVVVGAVLNGEVTRTACTAKSDTLDFNKVGVAKADQVGVLLQVLHVVLV